MRLQNISCFLGARVCNRALKHTKMEESHYFYILWWNKKRNRYFSKSFINFRNFMKYFTRNYKILFFMKFCHPGAGHPNTSAVATQTATERLRVKRHVLFPPLHFQMRIIKVFVASGPICKTVLHKSIKHIRNVVRCVKKSCFWEPDFLNHNCA